MVNLFIGLVLVLIMFSVGLTLTVDKFKTVLKHPRAFILGLSLQMIALPVLAFVFCVFSNISPEWKAGLFILSLCPGGTTSNFISYLLKGNTELSVAMTSVNGLLTLFTIPLLGNFVLHYFLGNSVGVELAYGKTVLKLLLVTTLPVLIGLLVKSNYPKITKLLNAHFTVKFKANTINVAYLKLVTLTLLGIMFTIKLFASENAGGTNLSQQDLFDLLPIVLLFNLTGLGFGYLLPKLLQLTKNTSMTIGIEVGLQNTSLAFLVIGGLLQNTTMQQPALVYALFSFWTAVLFGMIVKAKK
ncbi:MAG: BASS family bile acid:Na+ symporter [Saprospiraceae bacterium]|jgi:BASS family bile acid:Na+ symporter